MCFAQSLKLYWTYLRMVGPIDVKRKGGASVGYWVTYVTLTFDLTRDLYLCFFKVKFKIAVSQELLSDRCETKRSKWIRYWAGCMVLPFDHTHDLNLVVSRSIYEIALFEEGGGGGGGGGADWHGTKGMWVDHSWPWLWPLGNHGGWVDVPHSDWCDFRHWRAVDISSL